MDRSEYIRELISVIDDINQLIDDNNQNIKDCIVILKDLKGALVLPTPRRGLRNRIMSIFKGRT